MAVHDVTGRAKKYQTFPKKTDATQEKIFPSLDQKFKRPKAVKVSYEPSQDTVETSSSDFKFIPKKRASVPNPILSKSNLRDSAPKKDAKGKKATEDPKTKRHSDGGGAPRGLDLFRKTAAVPPHILRRRLGSAPGDPKTWHIEKASDFLAAWSQDSDVKKKSKFERRSIDSLVERLSGHSKLNRLEEGAGGPSGFSALLPDIKPRAASVMAGNSASGDGGGAMDPTTKLKLRALFTNASHGDGDGEDSNDPGGGKKHPKGQEEEVGARARGWGWRKLKAAHATTAQFKKADKLSLPATSYGKRQEYQDRVKEAMQAHTHLKLEHCKIEFQEVLDLKALFDDIDDNKNGVVSMDELSAYWDNPKFNSCAAQSVLMVLRALNEDITFVGLLKRTYPHLTNTDIKTVLAALSNGQKLDSGASVCIIPALTVKPELKEVKEFWDVYSNREGVVPVESFIELLRVMGEKLTEFQAHNLYSKISNPRTRRVHHQELSLWWINYFRHEKEKLVLADIQDELTKFWEQYFE